MVGRPRQGTRGTQPLGDDGVRPLPLALRQARVRDVAQDLLAEPPDGRGSGVLLAHDDLGVDQLVEFAFAGLRDDPDLFQVEVVLIDGEAPGQIALLEGQAVEARGDHRFDGRRDQGLAVLRGALPQQHAGRFHDEEGVATGAADDGRGVVGVEPAATGLSCQLGGLALGQRLEAYADLVHGAGSPRGTFLEQLGARRHQHQHPARAATPAGRDPLDQIEHLRAERVHILEQQRDRPLAGEPLEQRQEPGTHIVDEGRLVTARLREPHERLQPVSRVRVGPRHTDPVDELAQPLGGDVGRVLLLDAGDRAHHGGRGRERGAVCTDMAPPDEDRALGIEPGQELRREPRLPDARLAHDREQQWRRGRDHAGERLSEHRQFVVPAHERDRASHRPCAQPLDGRRRERLGESLGFHLPLVAERDGRIRQVARRGPDQHLARRGRGLQPGRGVDDRPGHEDLVPRARSPWRPRPIRSPPGSRGDRAIRALRTVGRCAPGSQGPRARRGARRPRAPAAGRRPPSPRRR